MSRRPAYLLIGLSLVGLACAPGRAALSAADIAQRFGSAVVQVYVERGEGEFAQASGFVVKPDGVIVTNWHVVAGATSVVIRTTAGGFHLVEGLLGFDPLRDLAVVKADARGLPVVQLGDSSKLKAGDRVVVIGNPLGLDNTVSEGIVSAIRSLPGDYKLIQTTAAMSEGSSGGPVFNAAGEVVAVACFIFSQGQNLNFAVPWYYVKQYFDPPYTPIPLSAAAGWVQPGGGAAEGGAPAESDDAVAAWELIFEALGSFPADDSDGDAAARYERAAGLLKEAVERAPVLAEAHFWLGYCYAQLGRWSEAVEEYKEAIRLKPDDANAHYGLALTYFALSDRASALEEYRVLKDLDRTLAQELFELLYP